jgi:arylamine N-acetyltransferase
VGGSIPLEIITRSYGATNDDNALFEKIVIRRRGGFCYEANGLFAALLRALGFDVKMLSAGVANAEGGFSPDFNGERQERTLTNEEEYAATLRDYFGIALND